MRSTPTCRAERMVRLHEDSAGQIRRANKAALWAVALQQAQMAMISEPKNEYQAERLVMEAMREVGMFVETTKA